MSDPTFVFLGADHLVGLSLSLAGGVSLVCAVRAWGSARVDRVARWALAVGCVVSEVGLLVWAMAVRGTPLLRLLPLHLCDLSLVLAPIVLLTGSRRLYEPLYFWGLGGALQPLLTPTVPHGFPAVQCLLFFSAHALLVTSALYATVVMRLRPTGRSVWRVWLLLHAYAAFVFGVNTLLGTNYLYIMWKPRAPTLLSLLGPWPWYLLALDAVALAIMCLCYAPFFVGDRLAARARVPRHSERR